MGGELGKSAMFYILISVWRAGDQWGTASVPGVSLGLVARLTWMDGGALARQHLAAGLRGRGYFPRWAVGGKARSLSSVLLGPQWRWQFFGNSCFPGLLGTNRQTFLCDAFIPW